MIDAKQKLRKKVDKVFLTKGVSDVIGVCDNVVFGVEGGKPFHNGQPDWKTQEQINWARCNARLFRSIAERLEQFAKAVEN